MKTIAIHPAEWREFCDSFTDLNRGKTMTVEFCRLDNRRDSVAENEEFQGIVFDTSGECSNTLVLTLGETGQIEHLIIEPIHIRLKENGQGQKLVQVEAEEGVTLIRFSSGVFPQLKFDSEYVRA